MTNEVPSPDQPSEQQHLLAGYVLGDLDSQEAQAFDQLMKDHPALQQDLAEWQQTIDEAFGESERPPSHLKSTVMAAVQQLANQSASQSASQTVSQSARPQRDLRSQTLADAVPLDPLSQSGSAAVSIWQSLCAASVLLALVLGFQNYRLWRTLTASQTAASGHSAETVVVSLKATDNLAAENSDLINRSNLGDLDSTVEVAIDTNQLEALLSAEALPPLPEDKIYALWTVVSDEAPVTSDSKNAILTATFTVDKTGEQTQTFAVPSVFREQSLVKALAVTIEDAAAPQQHQSSPILIQQIQ